MDKIRNLFDSINEGKLNKSWQNWFVSIVLFGFFFNYTREIYRKVLAKGLVNYEGFDWHKNLEYLSIIRESLVEGKLPWLTVESYQNSKSFLANPEITITPLTFFMDKFAHPGVYDQYNTIFIFLIGFIGTLLLKKRYQLNWLSYSILYFFFFLNGQIINRLSSGHLMWYGYFLLPFIYYCFDIGKKDIKRIHTHDIFYAFWLSISIYLGSLHISLICTIFYMIYALVNKFNIKKIFLTHFMMGLFSATRVIPAAFEFLNKRFDDNFVYPLRTTTQIFESLIVAHPFDYLTHWGGGWVETNYYIGLAGLVFISYFIFKYRDDQKTYYIPYLIITMLATGTIWRYVQNYHIPVLGGIRVTSRFLTIPIVFLIFQAARNFQRFQNDHKKYQNFILISLAFIYFLKTDLLAHAKLQFLPAVASPIPFRTGLVDFTATAQYKSLLFVGLVVNLIAYPIAFAYWKKAKGYSKIYFNQ